LSFLAELIHICQTCLLFMPVTPSWNWQVRKLYLVKVYFLVFNKGFKTDITHLFRISDYILNYRVVWIGYARDEVLGRNCRFLGGRNTDDSALHLVIQFLSLPQFSNICFIILDNIDQLKWIGGYVFALLLTDNRKHKNWTTMHSTYFELQVDTFIHFYLCGQSFELYLLDMLNQFIQH
jgi:hypothetical protein